jgi:hypothetical protein
MDRHQPPRTGHPIIDNLLAASWAALAVLNFTLTPSIFADLMVGAGAAATLVLTVLRIYEHLVGETLTETLLQNDEVEA